MRRHLCCLRVVIPRPPRVKSDILHDRNTPNDPQQLTENVSHGVWTLADIKAMSSCLQKDRQHCHCPRTLETARKILSDLREGIISYTKRKTNIPCIPWPHFLFLLPISKWKQSLLVWSVEGSSLLGSLTLSAWVRTQTGPWKAFLYHWENQCPLLLSFLLNLISEAD